MAVTEGLRGLPPDRPSQSRRPSGVGSSPGSGSCVSHAADDGQGLAKINLGVAGRMRQRNKHLPPALSDTADVVLHNGDLARKAVLITQPLEYPLRCVTLLLRTILILFQDTVDNTDERIELRADRRPRPDITRWHRIAQHLPDRARVDPKNKRAASRWLRPSIITAWRTRPYSSTRFIPHPSLQNAKGYR